MERGRAPQNFHRFFLYWIFHRFSLFCLFYLLLSSRGCREKGKKEKKWKIRGKERIEVLFEKKVAKKLRFLYLLGFLVLCHFIKVFFFIIGFLFLKNFFIRGFRKFFIKKSFKNGELYLIK